MKKIFSIISLFLLVSCSLNQQKNDYVFQITNKNKNMIVSVTKNNHEAKDDEVKIDTLPLMVENTFANLSPFDQLDSEETPYDFGGAELSYYDKDGALKNHQCLYYFKYTFYVKNTSNSDKPLSVRFYINEVNGSDSNRSLISTIRLMIFENEANDEHNYKVYAQKAASSSIDKNGNSTMREFVAEHPNSSNQEDEEHPLVTDSFETDESDGYYIDYFKEDLKPNQQLRYTTVVWLEGNDPQSGITGYPEGASLKMHIEIPKQ